MLRNIFSPSITTWISLTLVCSLSVSVNTSSFAQDTAIEKVAEPSSSVDSPTSHNSESPAEQESVDDKQPENLWKRDGAAHFMRIRKDRKGRPVTLDTSVTRYETRNSAGEKVKVDLIGAVHIGEQEYYEELNARFTQYDSLLYELVAPEGTIVPKGGRNLDNEEGIINPIAAMQKGMQVATGLQFQLDHIDYTKGNFVHADMSPEEFSESMKDNEESIGGYALRAIGQSMAMQSSGKGDASISMVLAMFSKNKTMRIRRAMAKQIHDMESGMIIFEGKNGSTIIDHRNAKCMEILQREIDAGKKSIGIFYGAGHLADMEQRMLTDFSAKRGGQYWLPAWKLTKRSVAK
jgi:GMP synthase-like glutamine amidotransferase